MLSFELCRDWEQLPAGWSHGDVSTVAINSADRVYVFNRSDHPLIVFSHEGAYLTSLAEGVFTNPHGITIDRNDRIYCVDDGDHTVRVLDPDGRVMRTIGIPGQAAPTGYSKAQGLASIRQSAGPFNRPTRVAIAPNGDFFVTDGYGNARIHHFDSNWTLLHSWGDPGDQPGQFHVPHSVWVDGNGRVFVCDRENDRIQIFDVDGHLLEIWAEDMARPSDIVIDRHGRIFITEMAWTEGKTSMAGKVWPVSRPGRVTERNRSGQVITVLESSGEPCQPGAFTAPHGLGIDSSGGLYVAEVSKTALSRDGAYHPGCPSLQKFIIREEDKPGTNLGGQAQ